jgi:hypothetical protein
VNIGNSVNGAISASSGSIDSLVHSSDCRYDIGGDNDLWKNISQLSNLFLETSEYLRGLTPTMSFQKDTSLLIISTEDFIVFKLAPCADDLCHNPVEYESVSNLLKGGDDWNGPLDTLYSTVQSTVINVSLPK